MGDEVSGAGLAEARRASRPRRAGRRAGWALVAAAALGSVAACGGAGGSGSAAARPAPAGSTAFARADSAPADTLGAGGSGATPVRVDTVAARDLEELIEAPGETRALRRARVRAPFTGRLVRLAVSDGQSVAAGDTLGAVVSQNGEAALEGARSMLASAATASDSDDARRALELARAGLVRRPLVAPAPGLVVSHEADEGDFVSEGDPLVTLVRRGSVVFVASVGQTDLARVRPGQRVRVELPARGGAVDGRVHGLLPPASSRAFSAPVRIDLAAGAGLAPGLFGTARVVVGVRRGAASVPEDAVLTNDITGTRRVALVDEEGRAHWVDVRTGVREGGWVQIVSPVLSPGRVVIVSGQVGLPEGARVRAAS